MGGNGIEPTGDGKNPRCIVAPAICETLVHVMSMGVGGGTSSYMGTNVHPQAIAKYRPDAPHNTKLIDNSYMSEAFEADLSDLTTCSDEFCAGVFFMSDDDWRMHLRYSHGEGPRSRLGELKAQHSAKLSAFDQAEAKEREAREEREALDANVTAIRQELERIKETKRVKALKKTK